MSRVYRADDLSIPGRSVAIKVLSPELAADPAFRARFLEESRAAASLEHPGALPIYAAGQDGDQLYIAMRFVDGDDLGEVLRVRERCRPEEVVSILSYVAPALDEAHAQ